jgi:tRNA A37 threonylcarbamoyladenosine synthetase subunit TsaC/SUA5/YrdC
MLDLYGNKGIDFIVDVGRRVATESTIIDMTSSSLELVRQGAGDASLFM